MPRSVKSFTCAMAAAGLLCTAVLPVTASPIVRAAPLNSWLAYLDTHVGRACTLSGVADKALNVRAYDTMVVLSNRTTSAGHIVKYKITTGSTAPGTAPISQSMAVPYVALNDGKLGVPPSLGSLGPGLQWSFHGFELFPSITGLRAHESLLSLINMSLHGTTPSARQQVRALVTRGNVLQIRIVFNVKGVTVPSSLKTPLGTYTDLVGLKVALSSMKALNANSKSAGDFSAAGGLAALFKTTLYFAPGIGLVASNVSGQEMTLSGCSNSR